MGIVKTKALHTNNKNLTEGVAQLLFFTANEK